MRYIVIRDSGMVGLEGRWCDFDELPDKIEFEDGLWNVPPTAFFPTGEFETREDGERAEVYRPKETA